jgi:hypothetical protein
VEMVNIIMTCGARICEGQNLRSRSPQENMCHHVSHMEWLAY